MYDSSERYKWMNRKKGQIFFEQNDEPFMVKIYYIWNNCREEQKYQKYPLTRQKNESKYEEKSVPTAQTNPNFCSRSFLLCSQLEQN